VILPILDKTKFPSDVQSEILITYVVTFVFSRRFSDLPNADFSLFKNSEVKYDDGLNLSALQLLGHLHLKHHKHVSLPLIEYILIINLHIFYDEKFHENLMNFMH